MPLLGETLDWFTSDQVNDIPAEPGSYLLMLDLNRSFSINLNHCGRFDLSSGRYYYAGSARGPGGLKSRLKRHFRQDKKIHWHIDHMTLNAVVPGAYICHDKNECELAAVLVAGGSVQHVIRGFGSSDCTSCISHLLREID